MFLNSRPDHALITVYGDNEQGEIARAISVFLPDRDIKLLAPDDSETLIQAAQNSVLTFIGLEGAEDLNIKLARKLKEHRMIVSDVIAFCLFDTHTVRPIQIMAQGFDACIAREDAKMIDFKMFLAAKIVTGAQRLSGLIREEEYRRLNDALSIAPISMIIFDADKRAVFVSDHYFRASSKIAPRLSRGLRVYDAFDMMIAEEAIGPDDPRYEKIRQFWYNLDGSVEFTLDDGTTYRMRAFQLPSGRGTVVTGQNMSGYLYKRAATTPKKITDF